MRADRDKIFESSLTIKTKLERQVGELRSQLQQEKDYRQEAETELDKERTARQTAEGKLKELQENSETDFDCAGKAGELVSELRKEFGKALPKGITVGKVQKILEGKDN